MNKQPTDPKYLRWSMYFFNSLYFFVSVTIWTLAIWTVYSMRYLAIVDEHYSYFVAISMATIGTFILAANMRRVLTEPEMQANICVFACCGAFWENKAVLYVFIGIMWLILILEIALSIWIFYNLESIKRTVRPMMFDLLDTYEDTQGSMVIDKIQYNFECCGVDSHLDWIHTQWGQENLGLLPGSCCHNMFPTCNISTSTFAQTGCYDYVRNYVDFTYSVDMTVLLFAGFAQIIGISLSYTLTRLIREYEVAADEK